MKVLHLANQIYSEPKITLLLIQGALQSAEFWLSLSFDPSPDQEKLKKTNKQTKKPFSEKSKLKESPSWGIPLPRANGVSVKLIFDEKQLAVDWILMLLGYSFYSTEILECKKYAHLAVLSKSKWKCG